MDLHSSDALSGSGWPTSRAGAAARKRKAPHSACSASSSLVSSGSLVEMLEDAGCADAAASFPARAGPRAPPADPADALLAALLADEEEARSSKQLPPWAAPPAGGERGASPSLAGSDRANLVNWLCSAAAALRVDDDALFVAVACLDALALPPGPSPHAVTKAAACLWFAAKWVCGARAPAAAALAGAMPPCGCGRCGCGGGGADAARAAARRRLLRAEAEVLAALDYGSGLLRRPTVRAFVTAALMRLERARAAPGAAAPPPRRAGVGRDAAALAASLAEQSLLESGLLPFRPSLVAAACVAYAHVLLGAPLREDELAAAAGVEPAAPATAAALNEATGVLRAVHAAVGSAAAAGNPYATTLRWAGRSAAAVAAPPITSACDARLAPLAAAAMSAPGAGWRWVLQRAPRP